RKNSRRTPFVLVDRFTAARVTEAAARVTGTAARVTGTAARVTGTAARVTETGAHSPVHGDSLRALSFPLRAQDSRPHCRCHKCHAAGSNPLPSSTPGQSQEQCRAPSRLP